MLYSREWCSLTWTGADWWTALHRSGTPQGQAGGNEGCVCAGGHRELLCECPEDRAAEQSCFRARNQQVWDDPSKIQDLRRSV